MQHEHVGITHLLSTFLFLLLVCQQCMFELHRDLNITDLAFIIYFDILLMCFKRGNIFFNMYALQNTAFMGLDPTNTPPATGQEEDTGDSIDQNAMLPQQTLRFT